MNTNGIFSCSIFMPPPATDRGTRGTMFSGCPSVKAFVRAFVRPGVRPVSARSYKPVDGISPNFG